MCLIVFAYKTHPKYDFIFAANRDELYDRPTRAAQFWDDHPDLLAGKDLKSGGTWMGINRQGKIAALTNFRDPSVVKENPPTRGEIVTNYLTQKKDSVPFLKELHQSAHQYMGFNVLAGTCRELYHYSNHQKTINKVQPGVHGLSNHLLDTPWPKVNRSKADLKQLIKTDNVAKEALFRILTNDQPAPKDKLPDTGLPDDLEKQVSPIFIQTEKYGTRSSTVLLIDKNGNATFEERRFKASSREVEESNRFEFKID